MFQQATEIINDLIERVTTLETGISVLTERVTALETLPPVPEPEPEPLTGVWISAAELAALPMEGKAWDSLKARADAASTNAVIIADQDGNQDVALMAVALVAARTGDAAMREKALSIFENTLAIDWRADSRMNMLEWGRNMAALYIAADVLDIHSGPIYEFLLDALDGCPDKHHGGQWVSAEEVAWESGSNANSQIAAGAIAGAIYTNNKDMLDRLYIRFQRFAGDRNSSHTITTNAWNTFETDETNPVGIQNAGATKNGCNVDGAVGNDLGRSGGTPCAPKYTYYGGTGAEGWIPAAFMLHRQGYPALTEQDSAIKRAFLYWQFLAGFDAPTQPGGDARWDDPTDGPPYRHLLRVMYRDLDIAVRYPTGASRTLGFTDWTHPAS